MAYRYSTPKAGTSRQRMMDDDRPRANKRTKQSPQGLMTTCARCDNDLDTQYSLPCQGCRLVYCMRCTGLTKNALRCIINGEFGDYQWSCMSCKATEPTLQNIQEALGEMKIRQEERIARVEEKIQFIETTNKEEISKQIQDVKHEMTKEIKEDVISLVDQRNREFEDRRRRELNIVVYNLPEGSYQSGLENKKFDEKSINEVVAYLGVDNLEMVTLYRLGRRVPGVDKPRVLKVILANRLQRKFILDNVKKLKDIAHEKYRRVVITRDLTIEQRKERKDKFRNRVGQRPVAGNGLQNGRQVRDTVDGNSPPREEGMDIETEPVGGQAVSQLVGDLIAEGLGPLDTSLHMNLLGEEIPNSQDPYLSDTVVGDETILGGFDVSQTPGGNNAQSGDEGVLGNRQSNVNSTRIIREPTSPDVIRD